MFDRPHVPQQLLDQISAMLGARAKPVVIELPEGGHITLYPNGTGYLTK